MLREGQSIARRPLGGTETWRKGTQVHWMGRRERRQATSRLQPQAEVRAQATVERRLGNQGERSRRPGDLLCLVVLRPGSQAQRPKVQTWSLGVREPRPRDPTPRRRAVARVVVGAVVEVVSSPPPPSSWPAAPLCEAPATVLPAALQDWQRPQEKQDPREATAAADPREVSSGGEPLAMKAAAGAPLLPRTS